MKALRYLLAMVLLGSLPFSSAIAAVVVPSDVAVSLTATPSVDLAPGSPITFTLSVSNFGPEPVNLVEIASSNIYDQLDLSTAKVDCTGMVLNVVDTTTGAYYYYSWYPAFFSDIAVGETRSCHLTLALTPQAPAITPFAFFIPSFIVDLNPSNDSATVLLQQVVPSIPSLSPTMLVLLAVLIAIAVAVRRRFPGSPCK